MTKCNKNPKKANNYKENWNRQYKQHEELPIQNGDIWINHFSKLFMYIDKNPEQKHIHDELQLFESEIKNDQNPLDFSITLNELQDKIQNLKPNKACGVDGILNEMIKFTDYKFKLAILKLFNIILSSGVFPKVWSDHPNIKKRRTIRSQ